MNLVRYTACRRLAMALCLVAFVCPSKQQATASEPPPVRREFRGAWIATVANIDWPSRKGLSASEQQVELRAQFDHAAELGLNAILFQVRPACDAIYASELEPWSEFLQGEMGTPPEPFYDPLEFAVKEAHKRGLQLHAWFNPYRARHANAKGPAAAKHVSKAKPSIVVDYGKQQWLDPGNPDAVEHTLNVIRDVVSRYDVDGVHFDDYFYPYPIEVESENDKESENQAEGAEVEGAEVEGDSAEDDGAEGDEEDETKGKPREKPPTVDFPDGESWRAHGRATDDPEERSRWRRENVDNLVRRVADEVKAINPKVMFGVSPFGIWRPGHPKSIEGFDPVDEIYADSRLWLQQGWVDYFTPQLYWPIRSEGQSFPVLLAWWQQQNTLGRHLWPGQYTSRVNPDSESPWQANEIIEQVELTRAIDGAGGNVHFSMKALQRDWSGVAKALRQGPYQEPALIPTSPWMPSDARPAAPVVEVRREGEQLVVSWTSGSDFDPFLWVLQIQRGDTWSTEILPRNDSLASFDGSNVVRVAVSSVDRMMQQSPPSVVAVAKPY